MYFDDDDGAISLVGPVSIDCGIGMKFCFFDTLAVLKMNLVNFFVRKFVLV